MDNFANNCAHAEKTALKEDERYNILVEKNRDMNSHSLARMQTKFLVQVIS